MKVLWRNILKNIFTKTCRLIFSVNSSRNIFNQTLVQLYKNHFSYFIKHIFILFTLSACINSTAEELTVIYPDVDEPYNEIFNQIKNGINDEFNGETIEVKLPSKFNPALIANKITTQKVIALGKRGWMVAKQIYKNKPVVVGALPIKPNGISGVSLMASPDILFRSLKDLAPKVKKITVLYTAQSSWIIENAQRVATDMGFEFKSVKVKDLREAVKTYDDLFSGENLENHAIWLPLDPITANDKVIVPVILEKAWSKKMIVFSSKPTHAKRGALFSAVPDNEQLGHQLAKMVNQISEKPQSIVTPLNDIKLAVNLRTAAHLGFNYGVNKRSSFALTFPN